MAALLFIALLLTPAWSAQAAEMETLDEVGPWLREVDVNGKTRESTGDLTAAVCDVNAALDAIAQGDSKLFGKLMGDAAGKFGSGAGTLEGVIGKGMFRRDLTEQFRAHISATGLFAADPTYMEDILKRIAALARESESAARDIANGQGSDADLMIVVQNSSDITRLIAVFFQAIALA